DHTSCSYASVPQLQRISTLFPYTTLFRSAICPISPVIILRWDTQNRFRFKVFFNPEVSPFSADTRLLVTAKWCREICFCIINPRSEEHTSELQSRFDLVWRLLLEKKKPKV